MNLEKETVTIDTLRKGLEDLKQTIREMNLESINRMRKSDVKAEAFKNFDPDINVITTKEQLSFTKHLETIAGGLSKVENINQSQKLIAEQVKEIHYVQTIGLKRNSDSKTIEKKRLTKKEQEIEKEVKIQQLRTNHHNKLLNNL